MKTWIVCVALVGCGPTGSGPVNVEQPENAAEACSRIGNPALILSTWHVCDPRGSGARCFVGSMPNDPALACRVWMPDVQPFCFSAAIADIRTDMPLLACPEGSSNCPPSWSCRPHRFPDGRTFPTCFPPSCTALSDAGVEGG